MCTAQYFFEYTHFNVLQCEQLSCFHSILSRSACTLFFFKALCIILQPQIHMCVSCLHSACKCTACMQPRITAMLIIIANFSTKNAKTYLPAAKTNSAGRVEGQIQQKNNRKFSWFYFFQYFSYDKYLLQISFKVPLQFLFQYPFQTCKFLLCRFQNSRQILICVQ